MALISDLKLVTSEQEIKEYARSCRMLAVAALVLGLLLGFLVGSWWF